MVSATRTKLPPDADAGPDQDGVVGFEVALDGSGSSDPDTDLLTFSWSFVAVPAGSAATLTTNGSDATFVPDLAGTYSVQLIVDDGTVGSAPDVADVFVVTADAAATDATDEAIDEVLALPGGDFQAPGHQNAFANILQDAIDAIAAGDVAEAINLIENVISRTDGCALRGSPDGNGPGRDFILDCDAQDQVYPVLVDALAFLTGP